MSEKHTAGPWACVDGIEGGAFSVYLPENGMVICSRNPYEDKAEEFAANARLIAAAPGLLEALRRCENALDSLFDQTPGMEALLAGCTTLGNTRTHALAAIALATNPEQSA
jgi:hypothetical protein